MNATNANSVTFEVTFNVPVQNVVTGDFTVNAGSVASITPFNSSTFDVTVNGLDSFTGTLTLLDFPQPDDYRPDVGLKASRVTDADHYG